MTLNLRNYQWEFGDEDRTLRALDALATYLCHGDSDSDSSEDSGRVAATVVHDTSTYILLAKKGPITLHDHHTAQRLSKILIEASPHGVDELYKTFRVFLLQNNRRELERCILALGLCVDEFVDEYSKDAVGFYNSCCTTRTWKPTEEFPLAGLHESESEVSDSSGKKVENVFQFLLFDIKRKCQEWRSSSFVRRSRLPSDLDRGLLEGRWKLFDSLSHTCNILRSSRIMEYLVLDWTEEAMVPVHLDDSDSRTIRIIQPPARELKRKLDEMCRYIFDLEFLAKETRRVFPAGSVAFKWVGTVDMDKDMDMDMDVPRSNEMSTIRNPNFQDLDPEIQIILSLHQTRAYFDPWQYKMIGTNKLTSFSTAHWISAYNVGFGGRWGLREWVENPQDYHWIWPHSSHLVTSDDISLKHEGILGETESRILIAKVDVVLREDDLFMRHMRELDEIRIDTLVVEHWTPTRNRLSGLAQTSESQLEQQMAFRRKRSTRGYTGGLHGLLEAPTKKPRHSL